MKITLFGNKYAITIASDKGPRDDNQDYAGWIHFGKGILEGSVETEQTKDGPETFIAVVCDGMGGLENGSKISARVCNEFLSGMAKCHFEDLDDLIDIARSLLKRIEDDVRNDIPNSGTTIAAIAAVDNQWCIMHLGDSRVYHGQDNWTRTLDHSPVESLLSKGLIDEKEALEHPMKNIVSKYIGGGYANEIEIERIEPRERIVLCSDGAFGYMPNEDFVNLLTKTCDASEIVKTTLDRGSKDNATVLSALPIIKSFL